MRPGLCWSCLASILKLLNFLQAFFGVSIVIYSAWILNKLGGGFDFSFDFDKLPAPWFVCALMGTGILVCLIAFTGYVSAEAISGCCLCFYAILTMILVSLEAVLLGDLAINKEWEKDLPYDSTGELKRLGTFIKENMDICKWIAVTIISIQAFSLLLAIILRAMLPRNSCDYDSDEDFVVIRRPLLYPQSGQTPESTVVDAKAHHSEFWSARMRQKYGLKI